MNIIAAWVLINVLVIVDVAAFLGICYLIALAVSR